LINARLINARSTVLPDTIDHPQPAMTQTPSKASAPKGQPISGSLNPDLPIAPNLFDVTPIQYYSHSQATGPWGQAQRWWRGLNLRNRLVLLAMTSSALPLLITTQGLISLNHDRAFKGAEALAKQQAQAFQDEYVQWSAKSSADDARHLSDLVEALGVNISNPPEVNAQKTALQRYLRIDNPEQSETNKSFKALINLGGRSMVQEVKALSLNASLPKAGEPLPVPDYQTTPAALLTDYSEMPIVKQAIASKTALYGMELMPPALVKRLGLESQAGKDGALVGIGVQPITVAGRIVGVAIAGAVIDHSYSLSDTFHSNYSTIQATAIYDAQGKLLTGDLAGGDGKRKTEDQIATPLLTKIIDNKGAVEIKELDGKRTLSAYRPIFDYRDAKEAQVVGLVRIDQSLNELESEFNQQKLISYGVGLGALLLAAGLAFPAAASMSRPLRRLSSFSQRIGQGERGIRPDPSLANDEIGALSGSIGQMVAALEQNEYRLKRESEETALLSTVTNLRTASSQELTDSLNTTLRAFREQLRCDRLVIYRCRTEAEIKGHIVAESVEPGWLSALDAGIEDSCIPTERLAQYKNGLVVSAPDVTHAGFSARHVELLEKLQVRSSLIVPIMHGGSRELFGLLIAHHCSGPHSWEPSESALLQRLSEQLGNLFDYVDLLQLQQQAQFDIGEEKDKLQRRALELLLEVDPVSRGDLTVRATVTPDEIGTVADSYNSTVESLRRIVLQVKDVTRQVVTTTTETHRQSQALTATVDRVQSITASIRIVANQAIEADIAARQAAQTVQMGDSKMTQTVEGMLTLRESVADTTRKLESLEDASDRIGQVVRLIGGFAAQTHLLALKASIEAARAGEQGVGFAVIADEVRSLAGQSAQATADIELLTNQIQSAVQEVREAMEIGRDQVTAETRLVEQTRQSLSQITIASQQINALVESISETTIEQSHATEEVAQVMQEMADGVEQTSSQASQVSSSFNQLLQVTQILESEVNRFKV
jgi:methyl-accepting chemotaxis protein PixJ